MIIIQTRWWFLALAGGGRGGGGGDMPKCDNSWSDHGLSVRHVTSPVPEPGDLAGAVPGRRSSSRSPVHCTCGSLNPPAELFLSQPAGHFHTAPQLSRLSRHGLDVSVEEFESGVERWTDDQVPGVEEVHNEHENNGHTFTPNNYSLPKRNWALIWRARVWVCLSHGQNPEFWAWYSLTSTRTDIDWSVSSRPIDLCVNTKGVGCNSVSKKRLPITQTRFCVCTICSPSFHTLQESATSEVYGLLLT